MGLDMAIILADFLYTYRSHFVFFFVLFLLNSYAEIVGVYRCVTEMCVRIRIWMGVSLCA